MKFSVVFGLIQVGEVSDRDIVETVLNLVREKGSTARPLDQGLLRRLFRFPTASPRGGRSADRLGVGERERASKRERKRAREKKDSLCWAGR
jgi:hypothetical protein